MRTFAQIVPDGYRKPFSIWIRPLGGQEDETNCKGYDLTMTTSPERDFRTGGNQTAKELWSNG
jgi:hypothetical protein